MKKNSICKFYILLLILVSTQLFSQEKGENAPNFAQKTIRNQEIKLSEFKGKVVLIDFWASWCGPCRKEFPFLIKLKELYGNKGLDIIAINVDNKKENMENFLSKLTKEINFHIIWDPKNEITKLYQPETMPTTFILDKKGIIQARHHGFKNSYKEKYISLIESLL